jgi:transposase
LAVCLSAANTHDSMLLEQVIDAVSAVKGPRGRPGRPRKRPAKLHLDKAYDYPRCRKALRRRGITPRIARRGVESSQRLGRHRFVVERSLAWLVGYRRLQVRYERRADVLAGFLWLACALICLESLNQPKVENVAERAGRVVVAQGAEAARAAVRKGRRMGSTAGACMAWV